MFFILPRCPSYCAFWGSLLLDNVVLRSGSLFLSPPCSDICPHPYRSYLSCWKEHFVYWTMHLYPCCLDRLYFLQQQLAFTISIQNLQQLAFTKHSKYSVFIEEIFTPPFPKGIQGSLNQTKLKQQNKNNIKTSRYDFYSLLLILKSSFFLSLAHLKLCNWSKKIQWALSICRRSIYGPPPADTDFGIWAHLRALKNWKVPADLQRYREAARNFAVCQKACWSLLIDISGFVKLKVPVRRLWEAFWSPRLHAPQSKGNYFPLSPVAQQPPQ